jgi:hypothetical protein
LILGFRETAAENPNNESKFMKSILKVKTPRNIEETELSMRRDSAKTINMMDLEDSDERKHDFDNLQETRQKEIKNEKNLVKVHLKLVDLISSNEPRRLIEIESRPIKSSSQKVNVIY